VCTAISTARERKITSSEEGDGGRNTGQASGGKTAGGYQRSGGDTKENDWRK